MSNMFYNYISGKIIDYFRVNVPKAGDKFYVQFETDKQVKCLYNELNNNTISSPFVYEDEVRKQKYISYELNFGIVKLVVAASMENGPHPDFLANLRNLVGVEEKYTDRAILFIHCSSLDSILGGAGSLGKEGMPLNILEIEKDIRRRITETGYTDLDKKILELYLDNKRKELEGTAATIFEYQDIIQCLTDSQITLNDYKKFEIFPDDTLVGLSEKQLKQRLEENHQHFVKISEIHNFGGDNTKLENLYGEDGAKILSKSGWEDVTFSQIEKFVSNKKKHISIEYNPIISNPMIWDKEEGNSKSKSRIRNILIFVDNDEDQVEFALSFSDFTKKIGITISNIFQSYLTVTSSGKKLNVKITDIEYKTVFGRFQYNVEGIKFDFKIAVARCNPNLLENIKTQYLIEIKNKKNEKAFIRINSEEDEVILNEFGAQSTRNISICENEQVISIDSNEKLLLTVADDYPYGEDNEDVYFWLSTEKFAIPMIKAFAVEKPTVIEGMKLWYLKRKKKYNFEIQGDNSLVFGTKKYFARDEFRKSLELEKKYINLGAPFAVERNETEGKIKSVDTLLSENIKLAFENIIDYFKKNNLIPSLTYINDDLQILYNDYLDAIIFEIDSIKEGAYLNDKQKSLFNLGIIKREYGDKEIFLTPLHPINIAYQLFLNKQNIDDLEEDNIGLLRKFQQTALLPYINIDPLVKYPKVYLPMEQIHSPEWKIYVEEDLPRYKGSKDFVSKLVFEKIREFIEHFSYLFSGIVRTPIKINLVNTGDCREIVQGIIKYYAYEINATKSKNVVPIHVTMYAEYRMDNAFETMSQFDDTEILVKSLGIEAKVEDMSMEEILDIYRDNVCFYYRNINDAFEYAHITFLELDDDHQAITTEMSDISSGVVMNGITSGVSSEILGDSYRTGFGIKYANLSSKLIDIAIKYNALNAAMNGNTYRRESCYALKMGIKKQHRLDKIYDASNWVTFINPKVDLNYFKSDPSSKDLLIIHYSDQYNMTSSGYDAITVTRKSKQYQNVIERYLEENGVNNIQEYSRRIINIFNALNGDWLLRMLSYKSHFPLEKLSILSAMKLAIKRYAVNNIIWIPISLEEILRVSGSVGLAQKGSIFSAKNLGFEQGATSDDLLLVGILNEEKVRVTFYPIEVKIGKVESDYLETGIKQVLRTRDIFDKILQKGSCDGKNIKTRLYRNFFMQQVLVNAEKMILYEVTEDDTDWRTITKTDLRRKLLNEEYEIVDSLIPKMGKAGVISFREDCIKEREIRNQNVLIVEKTKKEGVNLLAADIETIPVVNWEMVKDIEDLSLPKVEKIYENKELKNKDFKEHKSEELPVTSEKPEKLESDSNTTIKSLEDVRVLIGKDNYNHSVYWEFGNKALANRHVLITGTSGQGKTYSIQAMLYELAKNNISTVIFDYTEGFMLQQLEKPFKEYLGERIKQHIVYSTGVPINPFQRQQIELAGQMIMEKESDVAARLADIFSHVYDFGDQQYSAIFEAVYNGMVGYGSGMNMELFKEELENIADHNKTAKSVLSKMLPFFHTVEFSLDSNFSWGDILYADDAKVNIIQLTMFTQEMKIIITEMMLWDAWHYTKKFGTKDKPFVVVLDEAQNLSHAIKSPSAAILTEGRKFGWSAWFATQSLGVLKNEEIVRLLQASLKLYFKPTNNEIVKTAKQIDATGEEDWVSEVQKLKKGQCIVVGDRMKPNGDIGSAKPVVTSIMSFEER